MPKVYKRKPGTRRYADCDAEVLNKCLEAVRAGTMTQADAATKTGVCVRTIRNKLKGLHPHKPGKPLTFTPEEEAEFVKCTLQMSVFGFPMTEIDLRHVMSAYLSKIGRTVPAFHKNIPGTDFIALFLKRHPELTPRFVANIKKARAAVDEVVLTEYSGHLAEVLKDVPPENQLNYDESNLTDDPGKKRCLVKRGSKYPVNVCNSSKSAISFMMAATAAGEVLPPFVVYKAANLWDSWCVGGPPGTRYACTSSGWFDAKVFEEWFFSHVLPYFKKKEGVKVMIGDNLSSHLSVDVIKACQENNIKFVCLPPNSTHLTQPLDVAFFGPLKRAWRRILSEYKESALGKNKITLDKQHFPGLFKKLMAEIEPNQAANVMSGFKKAGINPINLDELLSQFKLRKSYELGPIEDSFRLFLEKKTEDVLKPDKSVVRKKKLNVPAGKSVSVEDVEKALAEEKAKTEEKAKKKAEAKAKAEERAKARAAAKVRKEEKKAASLSAKRAKKTVKSLKKKGDKQSVSDANAEADSDHFSCQDSVSSAPETFSDRENDFRDRDDSEDIENSFIPAKRQVDEFVIFSYEGEKFPGLIVEVKETGAIIRAMQKAKKSWKWPAGKQDVMFYEWKDVLAHIEKPKQVSSTRGIFNVIELNSVWKE